MLKWDGITLNERLDALPETDEHSPENVIGTWLNTNRRHPHIQGVDVWMDDGQLLIRAHASDDDGDLDSEPARVVSHVATGQPGQISGFEAFLESARGRRHLVANYKLGILVIQCYTPPTRSSTHGLFSREFFYQPAKRDDHAAISEPQDSLADADVSLHRSETDTQLELAPYFGSWRNAFRQTRSISQIQLLSRATGPVLMVCWSNDSACWLETTAEFFAESPISRVPAGFHAEIETSELATRIAANWNKGLLVIAAFHRHKNEGSRLDYFTREFFYHERTHA